MNDSKWQKYALIGGPLFVVLGLVGGFLPGSPPKPDADVNKITTYFVNKDSKIEVGAWLGLLGAVALIWWFATLWRHMSAAEGGRPRLAVASLAGLLISGAMYTIASALSGAMALRSGDLGNNSTVLWALFNTAGGAGAIGVFIHLLSTSALGFRSKMLPQWASGLGLIAALVNLVGSLSIASDSSAIFAFAIIGFFAWSLWILVVTVVLWKAEPAS